MLPRLATRSLAEFVGTAGLVCAVVGSGIAAQRLSPNDAGLQLLENSLATAAALVALLLAFGSVSGAHLNPVVTGVEWVRRRTSGHEAIAFVAAQFLGGALGAIAANAMFERPAVEAAARVREGAGLWLGEGIATFGLLVVIHGTSALGGRAVPVAVAAYIGAAYWFTSSTAFANPAVTVARTLSDSFAGIAAKSVPAFVVAQAIGAGFAFAFLAGTLPGWAGPARSAARDADGP